MHRPFPLSKQRSQLKSHVFDKTSMASQQQQQQLQHTAGPSDSGSFHGGTYNVAHRDTNAVLNINLQQGANVRSRAGAMIHMSGTIELSGKVKFSMKKMLTGGEMSESTYGGSGWLALGPTLFGDIITLHVDGQHQWVIGKDSFLACTSEITKEPKAQGLSKSLFFGRGLVCLQCPRAGFVVVD